ncbi:branched-chain amino acid ABC transporter permease [Candidatus Bathyarchaeota archaeon]|nr:branched-chain amino acid ABC transporter permease [Candidatus Bathyarchaeota archaeon]
MVNLAQVLFESLVSGSLYLLAAVGLSLTYGLSKFPNFAHAEFISFGGYISYAFLVQLKASIYVAFAMAFLASGILGALSYNILFAPLSRRGSSTIQLMMASVGLGLILRHTCMGIWGGGILSFTIFFPIYRWPPISTSLIWLLILLDAAATALVLHIFLKRSKIGKAIRATSDNPNLAMASGINVGLITSIGWFLSGALAGLGGAFLAAGTALVPLLGWKILLSAFAVTILGGAGSFYGSLVAAYIIGAAENLGIVGLVSLNLSADYRTAISFIILIILLLFKPEGLFRRSGRGD